MPDQPLNPDTHCAKCGKEYEITDDLCENCGFDHVDNDSDYEMFLAAEKRYLDSLNKK